MRLHLEALLLFLELVQKLTTLPEQLLGCQLSILELLDLVVGHSALSLTLRELRPQIRNPCPSNFLLLQSNTISQPSLGNPCLHLLLGHVRRQEEIERADFSLDLGKQLAQVLRVVRLGSLDRLTCLLHDGGLGLLLLEGLLAVLLEDTHTLHQILGQLSQFNVCALILVALGIARVERLPEGAHDMGMLRLLLVCQVRKLLDLVRPNQVGVLLLLPHRLASLGLGPVHSAGCRCSLFTESA